MPEEFFEGIEGFIKKGKDFFYLENKIGQDVSEEYDLTSEYSGAIKFFTSKIDSKITIPLSKKYYLLIFSHSYGCV